MEIDKIEVEGLDELEAKLLAMDAAVAVRTLRRGLLKASDPIVDSAKAKVPVDTGALRESIGRSTRLGKRGKNVAVSFIGPRSKDKNAIALANTFRNKPVKGIFWGHLVELGYGRQPPQPYLRPAMDEKAGEAIAVFAEFMKKAIERVAKRAAQIANR